MLPPHVEMMPKPALLLCLLLAAVACVRGEPLRVATYNVRLQLPSDDEGGNGWARRKGPLSALIAFHGFEVIGMQEVLAGQLEDLLASGRYAHVGVGRDDGVSAGEHSAILYLKERFELVEGGTFWLSETPEKVSFGWDATRYHRVCTWAHLRTKHTGREFVVFNSHFDHQAVQARLHSAELVASRAEAWKKRGMPVIVLGDFNATETSEPYRILRVHFADSRELSATPPYGPRGTFNGFQFGKEATERIDHLFVTEGITVARHGTLTDSYEQHYPSDHFPVVADLEF